MIVRHRRWRVADTEKPPADTGGHHHRLPYCRRRSPFIVIVKLHRSIHDHKQESHDPCGLFGVLIHPAHEASMCGTPHESIAAVRRQSRTQSQRRRGRKGPNAKGGPKRSNRPAFFPPCLCSSSQIPFYVVYYQCSIAARRGEHNLSGDGKPRYEAGAKTSLFSSVHIVRR